MNLFFEKNTDYSCQNIQSIYLCIISSYKNRYEKKYLHHIYRLDIVDSLPT